jgi:hypothetical protein
MRRSDAPALTDQTPADPQRVAASLEAMRRIRVGLPPLSPAQQCIDSIERIAAKRGGAISEPQRHLVAHCLRMPETSSTLPVKPASDATSPSHEPAKVSGVAA